MFLAHKFLKSSNFKVFRGGNHRRNNEHVLYFDVELIRNSKYRKQFEAFKYKRQVKINEFKNFPKQNLNRSFMMENIIYIWKVI